ncbi:hypothetical protein M8W81_002565 [Salmonella enterica]|nr:hypothetical protein [Salmonella enterica]EJF6005021.1 hypothetical protein [Salmonella enterica]EJF6162675.1 hypothetical protein [Salmonella enterica]EKS5644992.1 hypothetical protein [Salmonella enterica]EKS5829052.1 hypothetical protein [Salmonella enterica]
MAKKATSLSISEESLNIADRLGSAINRSRSAVFDYAVKALYPLASRISYHSNEVKNLEELFLNQSVNIHLQSVRGTPEITHEEFFLAGWESHVKSPLDILAFEHYRHNTSDGAMGKIEKKSIEEQLKDMVDANRVKGAIHIKTDRIIDKRSPNVKGYEKTILINDTSWHGYFFDLNQIIILPISDLIIFGIKEVLKRRAICFNAPYICWINIYHTNDMAVMVPIIRVTDVPEHRRKEKIIFIVNPFAERPKTN